MRPGWNPALPVGLQHCGRGGTRHSRWTYNTAAGVENGTPRGLTTLRPGWNPALPVGLQHCGRGWTRPSRTPTYFTAAGVEPGHPVRLFIDHWIFSVGYWIFRSSSWL